MRMSSQEMIKSWLHRINLYLMALLFILKIVHPETNDSKFLMLNHHRVHMLNMFKYTKQGLFAYVTSKTFRQPKAMERGTA